MKAEKQRANMGKSCPETISIERFLRGHRLFLSDARKLDVEGMILKEAPARRAVCAVELAYRARWSMIVDLPQLALGLLIFMVACPPAR